MPSKRWFNFVSFVVQSSRHLSSSVVKSRRLKSTIQSRKHRSVVLLYISRNSLNWKCQNVYLKVLKFIFYGEKSYLTFRRDSSVSIACWNAIIESWRPLFQNSKTSLYSEKVSFKLLKKIHILHNVLWTFWFLFFHLLKICLFIFCAD